MSNLLINEPPLQILPTLAQKIGLNEAIVLQQIHYWISNPKVGKEHEGRRWVYNSVREWQEDNFKFWSQATIKRAILNLKKQKLIVSKNLNSAQYDRTMWYTINYEALDQIERSIGSFCTNGSDQVEPIDQVIMTKPIPETTSETTPETTSDIYKGDRVATDSEINTLVSAVSRISKEVWMMGSREKQFDEIALTLFTFGATAAEIIGFGEWWGNNGYYDDKPRINHIVDHWQDFKNGRCLRKQANGKANGSSPKRNNVDVDESIRKLEAQGIVFAD